MRIQHNIPAMNAYRNYSANNSAIAKNLEKLSTGYRINRAGDDAAGLAISEKMRAQLSGLEQAQNNAKAGISLVQTGEGALTEVHSMLNRMYTLAEQSANGTYDDSVDRVQLQKEVESLKTEINRIADSTNYNGIKLLDGSLDGEVHTTVNPTTFSNLEEIAWDKGDWLKNGNGAYTNPLGTYVTSNPTWVNDRAQGAGVILHKDGSNSSGKTSFEIDLSNFEYDNLNPGDGVTVKLALSEGGAAQYGVITDVDRDAPGTGSLSSASAVTLGDSTTQTGNQWSVTVAADANGKVTGAAIAQGYIDDLMDTAGSDTIKLTVDGTQIEYNVRADGNKLIFEMTDSGYDAAKRANIANQGDASLPGYNVFRGNFNVNIEAAQVNAGGTGVQLGAVNVATSNIVEGTRNTGTQLADAMSYMFDKGSFEDGSGVKIGDEYYVFAGTDKTLNASYSDNVKVVDIRDLYDEATKELKAPTNEPNAITTVKTALSRLSEVAKDNEMFSVQVSNNSQMLLIREKETYSGDADLTTLKGVEKQFQHFTLATPSTTVTGPTGKALTLQIGDTAESFNQMSVNVADCHVKAMGIGDIDISTQEGAAAALDKIKAAVNYVSDIRGTMGALQNRLDHTINNLGVMQENIQDAESVIRDTDVAKEMMAYTKNNILMQASQAMLAQANQLPQGVLQLLG